MPEFIDGLPLHALIVHFVVVILPLSVLGAIVIAVWPAARRRFGWLVVAVAGVGAVLVPIASSSGEDLASRTTPDELVARHQELGESLIWWAVPLFIVVLGFMVLHTRLDRPADESGGDGGGGVATKTATKTATTTGTTVITIVAAALTVGIAVGTGVHTYRVGDAGARSVWGDVQNIPSQNGG